MFEETLSVNTPIYVTQPYLPPLEQFIAYLEKFWTNKILTNGGPFHQQLEVALCSYLGVKRCPLSMKSSPHWFDLWPVCMRCCGKTHGQVEGVAEAMPWYVGMER